MTKSHPAQSYTIPQLLSGLEALPQAAKDAVNFMILHSDFAEEITSGSPFTEAELDEMRNAALAREDFMLYALLSYCKAPKSE